MIDAVLTRNNVSFKFKITIKFLLSAGIVALAVILPQIVHTAAGASGGVKWLPMYFPVLLAGCILGWKWGLGVGAFSPVVSFLITLAFGNPMPALARLPYMTAELATFALVSGLFSKSIYKNRWLAFPATLLGSVSGRCVFLILAAIFESVSPLSFAVAWQQVQTGLLAIILQAVIIPVIVMVLCAISDRAEDKK